MTPYYEQDGITLYLGDCREVLPGLNAEIVFADPPYNVGLDYASIDDKLAPEAYRDWCREWYALARAAAASSVVVTPGMVSVPMWIADIERTHFLIAWTKANNCSRNYIGPTSGYQCWEPILVYGKSKKCILRDHVNVPIAMQADTGDHPCPKPLRLLHWIIEQFTEPGDLVLDPFVGSGTTVVAAHNMGRQAIGIDVDEHYLEIAAKRLAQGVFDFG